MRVFFAQLDPTIGDLDGNCKKIIASLRHARRLGADVALFPELTLCGYPPADLVHHTHFIAAMEASLQTLLPETQGLMALIGLARFNLASGERPLLNSAAVIQDGKIVDYYDKILLPNYDVFDERRYFEPGKTVKIWEWKGKRVGVLICEDIWQHAGYVGGTRYATDPVLELQKLEPDVVLNLSASPYQFQKPDLRAQVCQKAARTLNCPVFLCAQVGANDQLVFDGFSVYVDKKGNLAHLAKGFEADEVLIDLEEEREAFIPTYDPLHDLYRALVLGTRDFCHKQGFKKALLGLSGGIDSALVACIAVEALGKENVHGVYLPSRYSSRESQRDAERLAQNLGLKYHAVSIEGIFKEYLKELKPFFDNKPEDVAEENIQARIRGMILMALSNKHGEMVLCTGNKSEMALGYCTLYGDMAGGLSVISDVSKTQVYALCKWINRAQEIIPRSILEKAPSAELRAGQKDSDSLPDYAIVDQVLEAYVENLLSPEEIVEKYHFELSVVQDLIRKIHRAEFKWRQAAPGIRVTKKAFRVGRHYPIVQKWV